MPDGEARERPTLRMRVMRTLQDEIAAGQPPVGALLPGEHELCARFGVSRHTLREAMRELAALGLVDRRQGSGTRVLATEPQGRFVQSMRTLAELQQYATDTRLVIGRIAHAPLGAAEAEVLGEPAGARWVRLDATRQRGTEPIAASAVWVHPRFAGLLDGVREWALAHHTVYGLVEERSGEPIAGAEQDISAQPLPPAAARALHARPGDPALLFIRRYLDGTGRPMVCSFNWHRADRFTYRMRLRRDE